MAEKPSKCRREFKVILITTIITNSGTPVVANWPPQGSGGACFAQEQKCQILVEEQVTSQLNPWFLLSWGPLTQNWEER